MTDRHQHHHHPPHYRYMSTFLLIDSALEPFLPPPSPPPASSPPPQVFDLKPGLVSRKAPCLVARTSKGATSLLVLLSRDTLPSHATAAKSRESAASTTRIVALGRNSSHRRASLDQRRNPTAPRLSRRPLRPRTCQSRLFFPSSMPSHPIPEQQTDEPYRCRIAAGSTSHQHQHQPLLLRRHPMLYMVSSRYTHTSPSRSLATAATLAASPSFTSITGCLGKLLSRAPLPHNQSQGRDEGAALGSTGAGCILLLCCMSKPCRSAPARLLLCATDTDMYLYPYHHACRIRPVP
ncbi:hypothetical protein LZ30DRAFT_58573 [Colletotrichum cereale]|nr:hypothetical protein LZ30DRAFT_58573 [Colletotrichum cereale]